MAKASQTRVAHYFTLTKLKDEQTMNNFVFFFCMLDSMHDADDDNVH